MTKQLKKVEGATDFIDTKIKSNKEILKTIHPVNNEFSELVTKDNEVLEYSKQCIKKVEAEPKKVEITEDEINNVFEPILAMCNELMSIVYPDTKAPKWKEDLLKKYEKKLQLLKDKR